MTNLKKGLYRHYKGPLYKVLDVATHSETEEPMVVYQALYGDKGLWVRPLSMFTELVSVKSVEGASITDETVSEEPQMQSMPRFARIEPQTEVLEVAVLNIKSGEQEAFELAFKKAQAIIVGMPGYISHNLDQCVEQSCQYLLRVSWQTIEDHEQGFRKSEEYKEWKALLHHFYQPFPTVEHYRECDLTG